MQERVADLLFLMSVLGPILVIFWSIRNDKAANDEDTTGLLAMRGIDKTAAEEAEDKAKSRFGSAA